MHSLFVLLADTMSPWYLRTLSG